MPQATVNPSSTTRIDLKSLPEAYVVMRKQSYGERKQRDDIVTKITMQAAERRETPADMHMEFRNLDTAVHDFSTSIIEHNLTDHTDRTLDFRKALDVQNLEAIIGEEIEFHIQKMNRFSEDEQAQFRSED